ncbi:MAG: acyl--CoA ligase [Deltaproteobacteria bacterium]|nr:acyl--CoA ligase [Deltaproteobacteria bacterium]MBW2044754.1 acyl--CoA ligase [Deltaproteobacteria bacterium]MBW2301717.1 acyl--CoA ligase [Deltaproteobacteria bacterium]
MNDIINITGNKVMNDYLTYYAHRQGNKTLIYYENQEISYSEFDQKTDIMANSLRKLGLIKGDRVSVFLGNRPEFLITFWALMKLGVVIVPINTLLKEDEVQFTINQTDSKIVVTDDDKYAMFRSIRENEPGLKKIIVCDGKDLDQADLTFESVLLQGEPIRPEVNVSPDDLLSIMYTSGTTARPKGVMLSHRNYVYGAEVMAKSHGATPADRFICVLPLFHALSQIFGCMSTIVAGGSVVILPRFSASQWWKQVKKYQATGTALTGTILRVLLRLPESPQEKDNTLKFCNYGLPCSEEEFHAAENRFAVRLMQGYGMTETFCSVCMQPRYGPRNTLPSCVGFPTLGQEIRIVDERGKEVAPGELGEIVIKNLVSFMGYWSDPEATRKTLVNGWVHSGDIGYIDEKGGVHFVDRKKDMIKPKGENVAASEVERVLLENRKIEEVAVVGVKDAEDIWGEKVKAYIVLKQGEMMTEDDVKKHCSRKLADFKVPQIVEFVSSLPKTSIGKIDKKSLSD